MMGDVGYGLVLTARAGAARRSRPGTKLRAVAEIARSLRVFAIIFGVLFGEFFGDLGRRWLGLHPLLLDREEAIVPSRALALGVVHVVLGLALGVLAGAAHPGRRSAAASRR